MRLVISVEEFGEEDERFIDSVVAKVKLSLRVSFAKLGYIKPCKIKVNDDSIEFMEKSETVRRKIIKEEVKEPRKEAKDKKRRMTKGMSR